MFEVQRTTFKFNTLISSSKFDGVTTSLEFSRYVWQVSCGQDVFSTRLPEITEGRFCMPCGLETVYYASTLCPTVYLRLLVDSAHPVALKQNSILQYTVPVYYASIHLVVLNTLTLQSQEIMLILPIVYYSSILKYTIPAYCASILRHTVYQSSIL